MRHYSEFGFGDVENARRYVNGSMAAFFPGLAVMHDLTCHLIRETVPENGQVLVLGAGGGLELSQFAKIMPECRFTAVDPSPQMLGVAKEILKGDAERVTWVQSYIEDTPPGPFDAATCLLTLHLIPDDGAKKRALTEIYTRLKPGGAFAVVDGCFDKNSSDFPRKLKRLVDQARRAGIGEDVLDKIVENIGMTESIAESREFALLEDAGFSDIDLYFAALTWRGWIARRPD